MAAIINQQAIESWRNAKSLYRHGGYGVAALCTMARRRWQLNQLSWQFSWRGIAGSWLAALAASLLAWHRSMAHRWQLWQLGDQWRAGGSASARRHRFAAASWRNG